MYFSLWLFWFNLSWRKSVRRRIQMGKCKTIVLQTATAFSPTITQLVYSFLLWWRGAWIVGQITRFSYSVSILCFSIKKDIQSLQYLVGFSLCGKQTEIINLPSIQAKAISKLDPFKLKIQDKNICYILLQMLRILIKMVAEFKMRNFPEHLFDFKMKMIEKVFLLQ